MHTLNDISCIKTDLVEGLRCELMMKGLTGVDTCEAGQIVDMIKDLAQAEKDCMEKCYYESVVGVMDEYGFENEIEIENAGRAGYDTRRYASGRYAPKGHGHYSPVHGYTPMNAHMPMTRDNNSMGYLRSQSGSRMRMGYPAGTDGMYGKAYEEFDKSRRYYHESKDSNDKMIMNHHAEEHMKEVGETVRDIWSEADPEQKKKIKSDMSKLLAEMAI